MNANESNLAVPLQTGEEWLIIFGMILVILSDFAKFPEVFIKHHGQYDGMCGHFGILLDGRFGTKQPSCLWVPHVPHHSCSEGWNGLGLWDGVEINQDLVIKCLLNKRKTCILGTVSSCLSPYKITTTFQ